MGGSGARGQELGVRGQELGARGQGWGDQLWDYTAHKEYKYQGTANNMYN